MLRRRWYCSLGLVAFAALPGCENLSVTNWLPSTDGIVLMMSRDLEPEILGESLTCLAQDGKTYFDIKPALVARSWLDYLHKLGLPAKMVDETSILVESRTPDGHRFTITVMILDLPLGAEPDKTPPQCKAYLSWAERDYSFRGWDTLTSLEQQRLDSGKK